ncbi:MAG: hypothetical protein GF411_02135 [Candidatus Lokiarchaeota archaeon]|nr:hypothetical protein [Candidatus Lokiarchaeota archaeon]
MENPNIKILLELRSDLEEQIEKHRKEIETLQSYIRALDSMIDVGSFSTADAVMAEAQDTIEDETPDEEPELKTIVVMNKARDLELATIEILDQELRIIPSETALYDIKLGAFAKFFLDKILGQFQREDRQRVEQDELDWEDAFEFNVIAEDGILDEILIHNYGSEARLNEIERTLRWSLEKIYRER